MYLNVCNVHRYRAFSIFFFVFPCNCCIFHKYIARIIRLSISLISFYSSMTVWLNLLSLFILYISSNFLFLVSKILLRGKTKFYIKVMIAKFYLTEIIPLTMILLYIEQLEKFLIFCKVFEHFCMYSVFS